MLYITEVMWGEDVSLNPSSNSQYIELYNPGAGFNTPDDDASTPDVDERLTLVFYAPNEFGSVAAKTAVAATATAPATMALPGRVTDRIGTLDAKGAYWSPATAKVKVVVRELAQVKPQVDALTSFPQCQSSLCIVGWCRIPQRCGSRRDDARRRSNGSELDKFCRSKEC